MRNPLTLEERMKVPLLIGHDLVSHQDDIYSVAVGMRKLSPELLYAKEAHIRRILGAITILTQYDENCFFEPIHPADINHSVIPQLFEANEGKVEWRSEFRGDDLRTSHPVLHTALYNLVKNAFRVVERGKGQVTVSIEPFIDTLPKDLVYVPEYEGARLRMKFEVKDNVEASQMISLLHRILNLALQKEEILMVSVYIL